MSEREHAAEPVNAASIRAVGAVDPVAPRNITNKKQSYIWTGWVQASLTFGTFHSPRVGASRCQTKKKSATSSAAAAPPRRPEQVEMRRAGFFGDHPLRDKEHQLASRKCRRESTPQNQSTRLRSGLSAPSTR